MMTICAWKRWIVEIPGHHAADLAFRILDQVEREILDEEFSLVTKRLLIERMQDRMAGPVGGSAGPLCGRPFAVFGGHAAERALIDPAILGTRERYAVMFELDHRRHRLAAHIFDSVLVAQPVSALDGVVEMPAPVVLAHVAERRRDPALGGYRVAPRGKNLCDAGCLEPLERQPEGGPQPCAARADYNHVIGVVDDIVCLA